MNRESCRLDTFHNWTFPNINVNTLAKYGFYCLGFRDVVKCAFCHVEIGFWLPEDDIITRHTRFSTNCCLLGNCPRINNIPIGSYEDFEKSLPSIFGHGCIEIVKGAYSESDFPNINQVKKRL